MKYITIIMLFLASQAIADQRFETVGGFCHFITPEGFQTGNDDNEVFFANCLNYIRQKSDGTGEGTTKVTATAPKNANVIDLVSYSTSGAQTGEDCVMVDSNGTTYVTQDWNSEYKVMGHSGKIEYSLACRNAAQQ